MKPSTLRLMSATALLIVSAQSHASPWCGERHLNGHYVMFQNSVAPANPHIGRCDITIHDGAASGTCAFTSQGPAAGFDGPVSGTASIARDCSAQLQLNFAPAPGVNVSSSFDLQFTPDKQSFVGQWTNSFGLVGTSAGVRR